MDNQQNKLVLFQSKNIRRIWHNEEWFFSVVDIIEALTESPSPRQYWAVLKQRESQLLTICLQLKLESVDGKKYATDCVNTKSALRLIQSIPSKKAEPFKMWLAEVGKERLDEIENPELTQERMKVIYEQKGYSRDWIDKRLRGIAIRQNLTDEWRDRGLTHEEDYAILTSEISKATFGMTPGEYKKYKEIPDKSKANLRDNMTDLELIFTMLGEKMTTEISNKEKPKAMTEHKKVARRGGSVAGNARKQAEKELGRSVISKGNYLHGDIKKQLKRPEHN
ncbi:Bro-N domain-containing protein [Patescibacteria group bacterium]|nr:Bro-N domain-containing protein [Patescibacteria group bacterium]MBU1016050.1 Bro-N domain-containing protein [Patescibacteria group bacterium]MBU1684754.1 Bro-N domain-containing protein [Patescibacteria group bacterium]MBU1938668.1 Bro-N domain-containing protein [Patescibacteria group bacterium]